MSVQSVTGGSSAWQVLAEMRAARAAAAAGPAAQAVPDSPWSSPTQASGATGSVGSPAATPPLSGVLQFFQQLQSVDGATQAGGADPSGTAAPDNGAPGATGTSGDGSQVLADLQSVLGTLQQAAAAQGLAGSSVGTTQGLGASPATEPTPGSPADNSTQSGNDLALQWLSGLQGSGWQLGAAQLLA